MTTKASRRRRTPAAAPPDLAALTAPVYAVAGLEPSHQLAAFYDAAEDWTGKRRPPTVTHQDEDAVLPIAKRDRMTAAGRDLARNFTLTAWMIRRHLDYCATFELHATHDDQSLGDDLAAAFAEWSKPAAFDRSGRHDLWRYLRLAESRAVVDGDFLTVRLDDGTIQGIEADRIRNPAADRTAEPPAGFKWQNGVLCDIGNRAAAYQVHRRAKLRFEPEALVPAEFAHLHAYYERYEQARGVSPLSGALSNFRDCQESIDLALAKAKVSQLFALAIKRNADTAPAALTSTSTGPGKKKRYDVDFGRGPVLLDLEPGDDAAFMGENSPSTSFRDFLQTVLIIALKALDIPYSFYDESHTNFFGSRGAWLHYERAALAKRRALLQLIDTWKRWRLETAIVRKEWTPPRSYTMAQLVGPLTFVPAGMPWWKPTEELKGDLDAIGAGLNNPERVARERQGGDVYENLKITARVIDYAKQLGVPVSFAPVPAPILAAPAQGDA